MSTNKRRWRMWECFQGQHRHEKAVNEIAKLMEKGFKAKRLVTRPEHLSSGHIHIVVLCTFQELCQLAGIPLPIIKSVFVFPNGMVAVCDGHGKQMSRFQGRKEDVLPKIEDHLKKQDTQPEWHGKPKDAVRYGKCPGPFCGGEYAWLFSSDCDKQPWCEGCIDEGHERAREATDVMNEPLSDEEIDALDEQQLAIEEEEAYEFGY